MGEETAELPVASVGIAGLPGTGAGVAPLSSEERIALLRQPPPRFSRRFLLAAAAACAVLGGGGIFAEVALSARGINGPPAAPTASVIQRAPLPARRQSVPALLGLSPLKRPAPPFRLLDQHGSPVSLTSLRGKVVVLSFIDASCTSLCPVLAGELARLDADLGNEAGHVALLSVNTDPLEDTTADLERAARTAPLSGLGRTANWYFLTAPLASLDQIWTAYGVTVELQRSAGVLSYTGIGYLLDRQGGLAYSFQPFGDESRSGADTLPTATSSRFAAGLAGYVRVLLR